MEVGQLKRIEARQWNLFLSLVQRNERTMNNAPTVLRRKKFIVLAAVKQFEKNLSCKQIQNQLAKTTRTGSRRCYALQKTLLYAVRFLRSDENIIFCCCDAKRADVYRARQACFMTRDCNIAQQLVS